MQQIDNPFEKFGLWYEEAVKDGRIALPEAMSLSTVDLKGFPNSRYVLLKSHQEGKFAFYTNIRSPKGIELKRIPFAALAFYWNALGRQVRIRGKVTLVPAEEADAYFATRPRLSQIGAWASDQSKALGSREELEKKVGELEAKYHGQPIPRPPHWMGYEVLAQEYEFWQERPNRLHDRFLYVKETTGWKMTRLFP